MAIPSKQRAGTTAEWSWSVSGYSSADAWASSIILNDGNGSIITLTGVADGATGWTYNGLPATTQGWAAGIHSYVIQVSKGTEIHQPCQGAITIESDFDASNTKLTQLQTDLTTVETAIRTVVSDSNGLKSFQIQTSTPESSSDRQYEWMDLSQLRSHRAWLVTEIDKCKAALGLITHRRTGWRRIQSVLS